MTLTTFMVRNHPQSYRSQMAVAFARAQAGQDLSSIYQSYQRAAVINPKAVAPLVELAKLVQVPLITGTTSQPGAGEDDIVVLEDDFSTSPHWLTRMQLVLDREITRRLNQYPIVPTTTLTLASLAACAQARTGVCVALAKGGLAWHQVALQNSRMRGDDRMQLGYSRDALRQWLEENQQRLLRDDNG